MSAEELAEAVQRRQEELGLSIRMLTGPGSISPATLTEIKSAKPRALHPETLARLDRVLRWPLGTAAAYKRGSTSTWLPISDLRALSTAELCAQLREIADELDRRGGAS